MSSGDFLAENQSNESVKPVIHTLFRIKIKIMVLDYHDLYLNGFTAILRIMGFNVIGQARDGIELFEILCQNELPDIIIINYKISRPETFNVARLVKEKYVHIKVIINTQYTSRRLLDEMKGIGIEGLILKSVYDNEQINETLFTIYNGKVNF